MSDFTVFDESDARQHAQDWNALHGIELEPLQPVTELICERHNLWAPLALWPEECAECDLEDRAARAKDRWRDDRRHYPSFPPNL